MMKNSSFKQALVIMDRSMKSTMSWLTAKKEIGPILFVFVTGIILLKSGCLPDTLCFDEEFDLNICRKQTNEMKQLYQVS